MEEDGMLEDTYDLNWNDLEGLRQVGNAASAPHGPREFRAAWFGTEVAIKEVLRLDKDHDHRLALQEFQTLKEIRHPNIVQFIGVCKRDSHVYTITEHLPQDLHTLLHDPSADLTWSRRVNIARDATLALTYLHMKGIVHRNFHSRILLMSLNGRVKVSEVGLVRGARGVPGDCNLESVAPEVRMGKPHDERADIFAFGVMLIELITRRDLQPRRISAMFGFDMEELAKQLDGAEGCPPPLRDLALQCVATNPRHRPKARSILSVLKEIKLEERKEKQQKKIERRQQLMQSQQSEISEEDGEGSENGGSSSGGIVSPLGSSRGRNGSGLLTANARSESPGALIPSPLHSARSYGSACGGSDITTSHRKAMAGRERAASERNVRMSLIGKEGGSKWSGSGLRGGGEMWAGEVPTDDDYCGHSDGEEGGLARHQRRSDLRKKEGGEGGGRRRKSPMSAEEQLMSDVFGDTNQPRSQRNMKIFAEEEEGALGSIFAPSIGRDNSARIQPVEKRGDARRNRRDTHDGQDKCTMM